MPKELSPKDLQRQVAAGFRRFKNFRAARLMFLRNYTGAYYDRVEGEIGKEALNLIFNAVRTLVPHIVMSFPKHKVETPWLAYKQYAQLLGLALESHDKQINVKDLYRCWIVDAIFTFGVVKTQLVQSDSVYALDETDRIDTGTICSTLVDFDNYVASPNSTQHLFRDATFEGDRICVPRSMLLDSGLYKNDLVERLPSIGSNKGERARELSMQEIDADETYDADDYVEVVELWVPGAKAVVTIPGGEDTLFDDFLRVADYYGPDSGPYTKLALTPPVPGNPLPVPSVGVWNDLHVLANNMAAKIVEQATNQKDIVTYARKAADDAEEMRNAKNGESVAVDDPNDVQVKSFGGQANSNESHLMQLQGWFNMMSANPQQLSGQGVNANSATAATILQQNAGVGLEDAKDLVYAAAQEEGAKRAWFLHTDPLIQLPLTRRVQQPAQLIQGLNGPQVLQPPMMTEEQIVLTPEVRRGDFTDFAFTIQPESMGRVDAKVRYAQAIDFCVKTMPAVMGAAQAAAMMGLPFSPKAMLLRMAQDAGMDWIEEVFYDPEFQQQMMQMAAMGPQAGASKGQVAPQQGGPMGMAAIAQNGQPSNVGAGQPSPDTAMRQDQQAGAASGQQQVKQLY
jgi:hypothetical protein